MNRLSGSSGLPGNKKLNGYKKLIKERTFFQYQSGIFNNYEKNTISVADVLQGSC